VACLPHATGPDHDHIECLHGSATDSHGIDDHTGRRDGVRGLTEGVFRRIVSRCGRRKHVRPPIRIEVMRAIYRGS
jgi:hypothetical protein